VKLLSPEGVEITGYNQPGELVVQSPSVVLGYLNNDEANKETFIEDTDGRGRWMRTGDEAEIRKAPSGNEHVVITDRIKELIKVKVSKNQYNIKSNSDSVLYRVFKLLPLNWKLIFSHIRRWPIAP
jgi:acyl-CoA synthetase (AMP-forming)/AMP-acid ligase II